MVTLHHTRVDGKPSVEPVHGREIRRITVGERTVIVEVRKRPTPAPNAQHKEK